MLTDIGNTEIYNDIDEETVFNVDLGPVPNSLNNAEQQHLFLQTEDKYLKIKTLSVKAIY